MKFPKYHGGLIQAGYNVGGILSGNLRFFVILHPSHQQLLKCVSLKILCDPQNEGN